MANIKVKIEPPINPTIIKISAYSGEGILVGTSRISISSWLTIFLPATSQDATYNLILSRRVPSKTEAAKIGGPQTLLLTGFQIIVNHGRINTNINIVMNK